MATTFTVIDERPDIPRGGRKMSQVSRAVLETATNGKAVRVQLNGRRFVTFYNNLWRLCKRHGYRVRSHRDAGEYIFWAEKADGVTKDE